jgi:hypothetical protein
VLSCKLGISWSAAHKGVHGQTGPKTLPRYLRGLPTMRCYRGLTSPCGQAGSRRRQVGSMAVPVGRATSVPFTAVLIGSQRTITDNAVASSTCTVLSRRRSQSCPIWLWEQGGAGSNPAVPTISTNPLLSRGTGGPSLG